MELRNIWMELKNTELQSGTDVVLHHVLAIVDLTT